MTPVSNPVPWQSFPEMLRQNCERYAEQQAIVDGTSSLSYRELAARVRACAAALQASNIGAGDPVCIWSHNCWQWIVASFACWEVGAVVIPISARLRAREVAPILRRSKARLLFSAADSQGIDLPALLAAEHEAGEELPYSDFPDLSQVICFDTQSSVPGSLVFASYIETEHTPTVLTPTDRLGEILFTSGTTGEPKGVMLNQHQLLQSYWDWSDLGGLKQTDRFLVIPPFSHGFGINAGIVACVMRGMTHIVVDFFEPTSVLQQIDELGVTIMSGPPALFTALSQSLQESTKLRTSSLRLAYVGAAHVPEEIISSMQTVLGIERVINAYGLIEGCVIAMTRDGDSNRVVSTSVGLPLPDVEVRIEGSDSGAEVGEILVRSYGVMQGYFEAPDLTGTTIDSDGWLHTGDLGCIDEAGNLCFKGRIKEMYICNGFNVFPAEVEDLLGEHPAVGQVSVVGIANQRSGEAGVAFVIPSTGAELETDKLLDWARTIMAGYKIPIAIIPVTEFPLNPNGKIRKDELAHRAVAIQTQRME